MFEGHSEEVTEMISEMGEDLEGPTGHLWNLLPRSYKMGYAGIASFLLANMTNEQALELLETLKKCGEISTPLVESCTVTIDIQLKQPPSAQPSGS